MSSRDTQSQPPTGGKSRQREKKKKEKGKAAARAPPDQQKPLMKPSVLPGLDWNGCPP